MSGYSDGPKLGATFYPGGQDDFYMPELISPSPQRYVLILCFSRSQCARFGMDLRRGVLLMLMLDQSHARGPHKYAGGYRTS